MSSAMVALLIAMGQPDVSFREAQELRADAGAARLKFIEAAKGYDAVWQARNHSPAVATNRGRAHALAGDWAGAIAAVHAGLRESPSDTTLHHDLETLRDVVPYPAGLRPPPVSGWRSRVSGWDLFGLATVCVGLITIGIANRFTTRDGWALSIVTVGVIGLFAVLAVKWQGHREARWEAERPVRVLIRETTLRKGNGDSYEPRLEWPLPRGCEVRELFRRGGWVQVELTGGAVGWLPEASVITF